VPLDEPVEGVPVAEAAEPVRQFEVGRFRHRVIMP
jgi:hypothetical protein